MSIFQVNKKRIYVASSWRNNMQQVVVQLLRKHGHEVYDFKNPAEGNNGFSWRDIDSDWEDWSISQYIKALNHPVAEAGFKFDFDAMKWADTFVLVLPCGRSAHLELGWAVGQGKETAIVLEKMEPELMIKMVDHIFPSVDSMIGHYSGHYIGQ